ncbi:MAG: hypothetical protein F2808_02865 [Actinobacteria bacterium]|uniref:Regulatory protein RecX n=1 Tax=freshwater metagenome TaxID=449393 RepID=A0A6J7FQ79_9ZZZZ|nr:hypothetical protein [Actinomycetota bacterium]
MSNVTYLPWVEPENGLTTAGSARVDVNEVIDLPHGNDSSMGDVVPVDVVPVAVAPVDGAEIDGEDVDGDEVDVADLDGALLRALTRRDLSEREVRAWLIARGVPENDAHGWLDRLHRLGYVDDARMAAHLVDRLVSRGGMSKSAISRKLTERGIDRQTAALATQGLDDESEESLAIELASARAARMHSLDPEVARRRLSGFLARRGFPSSVIREAVHRALNIQS